MAGRGSMPLCRAFHLDTSPCLRLGWVLGAWHVFSVAGIVGKASLQSQSRGGGEMGRASEPSQ